MHVIRGSYHRDLARAGRYIHYISHREELLPRGERREIYGIGERYGDVGRTVPDPPARERAYQRLIREDAYRLRRPVFHQRILTVDDRVAGELARLPRGQAERELRDAFGKTLRVTSLGRQIQGVYAIHWHGGGGRPAHPHIHALFSPRRRDGCGLYLSKVDVGVLWGAWNREVDRALLVHRPPPLRDPTPGPVGQRQIGAWVTGTAIAQAIPPSLLRLRQVAPLSTLPTALRRLPLGPDGLRAALGAGGFTRDPLRTLLNLAAMTTVRPIPRPLVAVARALNGLTRDHGPEL